MNKAPQRWKPGQSGNPKGAKPGALRLLKALGADADELIAKVIEMAKDGDIKALRICIDRIAPPLRPESPAVKIPQLKAAKTLPEKAAVILDAVASGVISPDTGERLLAALAHAGQIIELDKLSQRVAELEAGDLT